jgi:predicted nucleic acid-binding protein
MNPTETNNRICLDANVIIASVCNELTHPFAKPFFRNIPEDQIFLMPALIGFEITNSLARKRDAGEITDDECNNSLDSYATLPILIVWQNDYLKEALRLQQQGLPSAYDAAYVATAKLNNIPFITEDKLLIKKAKKLYPHIYNCEEWLNKLH